MHIKEFNNSNALKRGQLVVAFKGSIFYGDSAFTRLQQSLESGVLQFYRHRQGPVPIHSGLNLARRFSGIHSRLDVRQLASPDSVSRTIWFGKAASKSCPGTNTRTPLTVCAQPLPSR